MEGDEGRSLLITEVGCLVSSSMHAYQMSNRTVSLLPGDTVKPH